METIAVAAVVMVVAFVVTGRARDRQAKAVAEQRGQADRQREPAQREQRALLQQVEQATNKRRAAIAEKYADEELRRHILEGRAWIGMSREQLLDA